MKEIKIKLFKPRHNKDTMELIEIKKRLEHIKKEKRVIAVLLFGSYARNEYYRDIDICLVLDKKYSDREMTNLLIKNTAELPNIFDVKIFQMLPLYIMMRILKESKIIFCNNEDVLYNKAFETIKEFNLFERGYNNYLESIYER